MVTGPVVPFMDGKTFAITLTQAHIVENANYTGHIAGGTGQAGGGIMVPHGFRKYKFTLMSLVSLSMCKGIVSSCLCIILCSNCNTMNVCVLFWFRYIWCPEFHCNLWGGWKFNSDVHICQRIQSSRVPGQVEWTGRKEHYNTKATKCTRRHPVDIIRHADWPAMWWLWSGSSRRGVGWFCYQWRWTTEENIHISTNTLYTRDRCIAIFPSHLPNPNLWVK